MHRNIKLLTWINFFTDFRLYAPVAIIYFSTVAGSLALGMAVFSAASIATAIFELPTGLLSDYLGRKNTVIMGAASAFLSVVCYALGFSLWILIIGAIFEGLSRSFYSGNNDAFLHETLQEHNLTEDYQHHHGRLSSMFQVALGISSLIGGFIAFYSTHIVFWLSVIPQLLCVLLSLKLIEPNIFTQEKNNIYSHLKEAFILFIKNPQLRLLSITGIIDYGFGEAGWVFRSAFINSIWPIWAVGIPQTISNVGAAIGFFYAGNIIKRFSAAKVLFFGEIYSKFINLVALINVTIFSPILMTTTSIFFGLGSTAESTLLQKNFSNHQRATMGSLNSLAGSVFFAIAAYGVGLVGDKFGPANSLLIIQVLTTVNLFFYWKLLASQQVRT